MTLLHVVALEVYTGSSSTFVSTHAVCLDWKHVAALREQNYFMAQVDEDRNRSVFPVTQVDMTYGKTYILKHPYQELLKAFMATRGET